MLWKLDAVRRREQFDREATRDQALRARFGRLPGPERDAITARVRGRCYCAARLPADSKLVELLCLAELARAAVSRDVSTQAPRAVSPAAVLFPVETVEPTP